MAKTTTAAASVYDKKDVFGWSQYPDEADFKVTITADRNDKQPAQVVCQFQEYLLPRGKQILVKEPIVHALDIAVTHHIELTEDGDRIETPVHTYPFTAVPA